MTEYNEPENIILRKMFMIEASLLEKLKVFQEIVDDIELQKELEKAAMSCNGRLYGLRQLIGDEAYNLKLSPYENNSFSTVGYNLSPDKYRYSVVIYGILQDAKVNCSVYLTELTKGYSHEVKNYFKVFAEMREQDYSSMAKFALSKGLYIQEEKLSGKLHDQTEELMNVSDGRS